jgi:hypothetical protein
MPWQIHMQRLTMTLTEFLRARLDEDEARAVALRDCDGVLDALTAMPCAEAFDFQRLQPQRVLAEVEAKRGLIASAREAIQREAASHGLTPRDDAHLDEWCEGPVLQYLALPYADHPDYQPEWRP